MPKKEVERDADTAILSRHTEQLTCQLTHDEHRQRGVELADCLGKIGKEQSRQDSIKASMKSDMAALEAKRDRLSYEVQRGEELRDVEVEETADFKLGKVFRIRTDTGEVMGERKLLEEERQTSLPGTGQPVGAH